jgi:hypothetical protein
MSVYPMELGFAAGTLIATPIGVSGPQTPIKFGVLQDVDLSMSADLKPLYGQNRVSIALAPGKTKIELKAKFAQINAALFNNLFFGGTIAATQTLFQDSEALTVPATGANTVSSAHASLWTADEGVVYQASGLGLTAAATPSALGQYSVAAGVYTFESLDASALVYASYLYSSATGEQITFGNPKMGVGPSFSVMLNQPFDGRQATYIFPVCQASKLQIPTKQDDWVIQELDFEVAANAAGIVGYINTSL